MDFNTFLLLAPSILLGLTLHEFAHGFVAYLKGDPTAKNMGRLTLNPLKHLDLFGTIMLFIVHFGWAKPVIVNPANLKNPKIDMLQIALAGPATNLLLAAIFGISFQVLKPWIMVNEGLGPVIQQFLFLGTLINASLAVFNMLPIPPLDGSRIIHVMVPDRYEEQYYQFQRIGGMVLFGVLLLGFFTNISIISKVLMPPVHFITSLFMGI
ncbi:site-2 protease family protein [bacterium]|nr:site-2 protease family protein [bacterium]